MTDRHDYPEGGQEPIVHFGGLKIGISGEGLENVPQNSAIWKAVCHVRRLLEDFQLEVNASDFFAGKILDTDERGGVIERPLLDALVYVVDDEPATRIAVERILKRKGFSRVKGFPDAQDAYQNIYKDGKLSENPHLIISDTNMPRMQGTQLALAIEEIDPSVRPRFLALTGNFFDGNIGIYVALGRPVLAKPMEPGNVLALAIQELRQHPSFRPAK